MAYELKLTEADLRSRIDVFYKLSTRSQTKENKIYYLTKADLFAYRLAKITGWWADEKEYDGN